MLRRLRKVFFTVLILFALAHLSVQGQKATLSFDSIPPAPHTWEGVDYSGNRWVKNLSKPYELEEGLAGRHLFISPSHGRYFNGEIWRWQRPVMFCTTEDLLTQSFVFPFLIPMLENAGAIVYSPRERDPQYNDAVVDNDQPGRNGLYQEVSGSHTWATAATQGFLYPMTTFNDLAQPMRMGTARIIRTTRSQRDRATAIWQPSIPQRGQYAVYVTYPQVENAVSDANYTVHHAGGETTFRVNQRIGAGTWLYLGTFLFNAGITERGRVTLHNGSRHKGVIVADAVRFGGGMGTTQRSVPQVSYTPDSIRILNYPAGTTSGLLRQLEGARYYAQWAGLPDTLYNADGGMHDYNDDIRARAHLLNFLSGGSAFVPDTIGRGVPFELSFALHTDAGYNRTGTPYGTLAIATPMGDHGETTFRTGTGRVASIDFAHTMLHQVTDDLTRAFGVNWPIRELRKGNYGESRSPLVPSIILELLAHQNYTDMKFAHDPNFKFTVSRAIYKAILRHVCSMHGRDVPPIQPLPVKQFSARLVKGKNQVRLSWQPAIDPLEPTAAPSDYIVYTRTADSDFDNGRLTGGKNHLTLTLTPGLHYIFKVAALNEGGESFASQPLSAYCAEGHASGRSGEVLIVNAFNRLSGPARVETDNRIGFDLDEDLGVPYHYTTAFSGRQTNFSPAGMGKEGPNGLGFGGTEWVGQLIRGNQFNGIETHATAISAQRTDLSISSMSSEAFEQSSTSEIDPYHLIDYVAGLERNAPHNLLPYKAFSPKIRKLLTTYHEHGGHLLVSGSFVGSDMTRPEEREFLNRVLGVRCEGTLRTQDVDALFGLRLSMPFYNRPNSEHFACTQADVLSPVGNAFSAFAYGRGGYSAGVAVPGNGARSVTMGVPFECINNPEIQSAAMTALLDFLLP